MNHYNDSSFLVSCYVTDANPPQAKDYLFRTGAPTCLHGFARVGGAECVQAGSVSQAACRRGRRRGKQESGKQLAERTLAEEAGKLALGSARRRAIQRTTFCHGRNAQSGHCACRHRKNFARRGVCFLSSLRHSQGCGQAVQ